MNKKKWQFVWYLDEIQWNARFDWLKFNNEYQKIVRPDIESAAEDFKKFVFELYNLVSRYRGRGV